MQNHIHRNNRFNIQIWIHSCYKIKPLLKPQCKIWIPQKRLCRSSNVNCRDFEGRQSTPLHFAAGYNRVEVVEYLLSMGADVQVKLSSSNFNTGLTENFALYTKIITTHEAIYYKWCEKKCNKRLYQSRSPYLLLITQLLEAYVSCVAPLIY